MWFFRTFLAWNSWVGNSGLGSPWISTCLHQQCGSGFLKSHCDGFLRNKFSRSNSMKLVSISLRWCGQRAEIILALGGFSSSIDVSAIVFKPLQSLKKSTVKDIWNYMLYKLQCFSLSSMMLKNFPPESNFVVVVGLLVIHGTPSNTLDSLSHQALETRVKHAAK